MREDLAAVKAREEHMAEATELLKQEKKMAIVALLEVKSLLKDVTKRKGTMQQKVFIVPTRETRASKRHQNEDELAKGKGTRKKDKMVDDKLEEPKQEAGKE